MLRRRIIKLALGAPAAALSLAACSPIAAFDGMVGVEPGARKGRTGVAYGSHPRQKFDVWLPSGAGPFPMAVFIYGGSWRSGSRGAYSFVGRTMAARGFTTIIPDYRLVPEAAFPAFVDDTADCIAHVSRHASEVGGDGSRLYVFGHSAGAYNAMMAALSPRFLARQGATRNIIRAAAGIAGPYDFLPFDNFITRSVFGAWPSPRETQPIYAIESGAPPILLLHGADDRTVTPDSSRTLDAALRAAGVSSELKIYPGVGHVTSLTSLTTTFRSSAPVLDDLVGFFNRHGARTTDAHA